MISQENATGLGAFPPSFKNPLANKLSLKAYHRGLVPAESAGNR